MNRCPPGKVWNEETQKCCPDINYNDPQETFPAFWKANIERDYSCFDFDEAFEATEIKFERKLIEHGSHGGDRLLELMDEIYGEAELTYIGTFTTGRIDEDELYNILAEEMQGSTELEDMIEASIRGEYTSMDEDELAELLKEENADDIDDIISKRVDGIIDDTDEIIAHFKDYGLGDILSDNQQKILANYVAEQMWDYFRDTEEYSELVDTHEKLLFEIPTDQKEQALLFDRIINTVHITGSIWDTDVDKIRKNFEEKYEKGLI